MDQVYQRIDTLICKAIVACDTEVFMYSQHAGDDWAQDRAAKYVAVLEALKAAERIGRILFT